MIRGKTAIFAAAALLLAGCGAAPRDETPAPPSPPAPVSNPPEGASAVATTPEPETPNALAARPEPSGIPVLADLSKTQFRAAAEDQAEFALAPAEGRPYARVARLRTARRPPQTWNIEIKLATVAPIREGDTLWLRFDLRGTELQAGAYQALATVAFQLDEPPYPKAFLRNVNVGADWRSFSFAFRAPRDYAPGAAALAIHAGFDPQTIEIGGVELLDLGLDADPAALPATQASYRGREPDAAWRRAALERIRRIRMSDLEVRASDAEGRPAAGVEVSVRQTRSAYRFGSALNEGAWTALEGPDRDRYRAEFVRLFNAATFEGDMKWPSWIQPERRARALALLDEMDRLGISVRGHTLVWPGWKWLPPDLRKLENDPPRLRAAVRERIRDAAGALRGRVPEWDVLNEPFHNNDLIRILGRDEMVEWFRAARAADPEARLFLNENAILNMRANAAEKAAHFEETIRFLLDAGAPLGGLGMQGHCYDPLTPPDAVLGRLDRFGRFGLPIVVTECDILVDDEALQGDYFRDFLIAVFSHPATDGFFVWGFWDGRHWKQNAPIFRKNWSLKPSGRAWEELVLGAWRTNETETTDAAGVFRLRAFRGDYEVTVRAGGRETRAAARVDANGGSVHVRIP